MKIIPVAIAICVISVGIITIPTITDQFADAGSTKKVHFTKTIESSTDPGRGFSDHQMALILAPNTGTLYDGSLTYTASTPVQIIVLHELTDGGSKGQPTWTVDGNVQYAISVIDSDASSGSFEFTGAALALRSVDDSAFAATTSVDGWIRGQPVEIFTQPAPILQSKPELNLARAQVPATIPLHAGLYGGEQLLYIITDSNDEEFAQMITEKQKWQVELATTLSSAPAESLATVYLFTDGIAGDGIYGYQDEVFSDTPEQDSYSALRTITNIEWKAGQTAEILDSQEKILDAQKGGRIDLKETDIILNVPQIKWPEGQMEIRDTPITSGNFTFGSAQVIEIDEDSMSVTFVAHRAWGPNGQTLYYIVTDATPTGPAQKMGIVDAPTSAHLITSAAAIDLFQFNNGVLGSGPLGFQPGITSAVLGDENYSPMWRIFLVEWDDPLQAQVLETKSDIDALKAEELLSVSLARPLNSDHIVNCPLVDPFQSIDDKDDSGDSS